MSPDPDDDALRYRWYVYAEPGSFRGAVAIREADTATALLDMPEGAAGQTIHVILEVTDSGSPPLTRYRRVLIRAVD